MAKLKQVILVRKDLKMRRGKEIAQGAHAAMDFLVEQIRGAAVDAGEDIPIRLSRAEIDWLEGGAAKVCLRVNSEQELLDRHALARARGLRSHLIRDSGRTEFGGAPTYTACAIGPDLVDSIDAVTGDLVPY